MCETVNTRDTIGSAFDNTGSAFKLVGMSIAVTPGVSPLLTELVAEEIRALMARRRVKQSQLARALGVSEQWVSLRLRGVQPIDLNDLQRIAAFLSVEPITLFPATTDHVPSAFDSVDAGPLARRHQQPNVRKAAPADRPITPRPSGHPQHAVPASDNRRPARIAPALLHV